MATLLMQDEKGSMLRRFPGSHLSSPLTYYPQRLIIKHHAQNSEAPIEKLRDGVRTLQWAQDKYPGCSFIEDPSAVYASVFRASTRRGTPEDTHGSAAVKELSQMLLSCCLEADTSLNSMSKQHPGLAKMELKLKETMVEEVIMSTIRGYEGFKFTTEVRGSMQNRVMEDGQRDIIGPFRFAGWRVCHQGEIVLCIPSKGPKIIPVLNYDQWVMICDTVVSRFITLLVCELNSRKVYDILPQPRFLRELYEWGDSMLAEEGINAYAVIGEFESIVTSCFVSFSDSDPLSLGEDYVKSVHETALEIESEYGINANRVHRLMTLLRGQASVNVLSEVFGLRKHWGNPMVEAYASGRAVQDKLNEDLPISGVAVMELLAAFNRMITLAFIKVHNRWPECSFKEKLDGIKYPLMVAKETNNTAVPEMDEMHNHMDWALLEFKCNCVVDTYENQLETLSDKSVSLPVSELDDVYFKGMIPNQKSSGANSERRLILKFLQSDQIPVIEILRKIMMDEAPDDWFANSAAMKGTEVKHLKARIFAVLTYEIRQYFAVTEDMIKKHLFPYNPHQTMTLNETELLMRLRGMAKQMDVDAENRTLNVMHIVDFSKWNLRMRYENTCQVFCSIDNFLGLPGLIEKSHIIFEDMINLVQDPYNPPVDGVANTLSDTIWRLHTRGLEGQRQKGWTILTSALLSDLERTTGVHSEICGQGDNQVLLTMFPIPEQYKNANSWIEKEPGTVKAVLDDYYMKLEQKCAGVGLKVKTAETCRSLFYMNYGKRLFFCGVELSMTLKRLSKAMTESNDAFPLTETRLKTSQRASYASGLYSHPSPWPFIMSRFCTMLTLYEAYHYNPLVGKYGKEELESEGAMDGKFYSILTKIPASLGGPSQQPFAAFMCRGHPDPLCEELVMLCLKAKNGCKISQSIINCAKEGLLFKKDVDEDKTSLILSPYSLNLNVPASAKSPISKAVLPALRAFCQNSSVSSLLSLEVDEYENELLAALSQLEPFNPLVANDIYSRSIVGQRQSFVDGLKNATSICRLVQDSYTNPIIDDIKLLEKKQLTYWINLVKLIHANQGANVQPFMDHDKLADLLREKSWGTRLEGVTVPHPLETFRLVRSDDDVCANHKECGDDGYLVFVRHSNNLYSPPGIDSLKTQLTRSRTGSPYLGSMITEGITSQQVVCKNPTKAWMDACKLNVLRQWVSLPESKMDSLLRKVIRSRTDAEIEFIDKVTGRPSRISYVHRADFTATKKVCAITATSNMYTRIYTSSNRMGKYSTSDVNYHLPYGPAYLSFGYLLCLSEVMSPQDDWSSNELQVYHCHVVSEEIPEVYDGEVKVNCSKKACKYPGKPPAMLFAKKDSLQFEDRSVDEKLASFKLYTRASTRQCQMAYSNVLLGDSFIREIVKKELISSTMSDLYNRREIAISIGDMRMTGVKGFVKALAQNFCLIMGRHRALIANRSSFIYSMIDMMKGFSRGFWSGFCNAMGKSDLIEKLYSLTEGCGHHYDGASQKTLVSTWQVAIAVSMYDIIDGIRRVGQGGNAPFTLFAPSLSAARHLYAKYVELCIWIFGSSAGLRDLDKLGRTMSNTIHNQKDFLDCRKSVRKALNEGCLKRIGEMKVSAAFNIPLYNVNDPWIDLLRRNEFKPAVREEMQARRNKRPDYVRVPDLRITVGDAEQLVVDTGCTCDLEEEQYNHDMVESFFLRSGSVMPRGAIILDTANRYMLSLTSVIVLNDKVGEAAKVIASHPHNQRMYVAPCRDITEFAPHTAGSYYPPSLLKYTSLNKVEMASSSALIGNVLSSERSRELFLSHVREGGWLGCIMIIEPSMIKLDLGELEVMIQKTLDTTYNVDTIKWVMIVAEFKCRHRLAMTMSRVAEYFEIVAFNRSAFTQTGGHGAIVGHRRRDSPMDAPLGRRVLRLENHQRFKKEFQRGDHWDMPAIAKLTAHEQKIWIESVDTGKSSLAESCDLYLKGWGVGKNSANPDVMMRELIELSSYHRSNMELIYKTTMSTKGGGRRKLTRSFVLNLSTEGGYSTLSQQMDHRVRCLILYEILRKAPRTLTEVSQLIGSLATKQYELTIEDKPDGKNVEKVTFFGGYQHQEFKSKFSRPLYSILGHVYGVLDTGVSTPASNLRHFRVVNPRVHRKLEIPVPLRLVKDTGDRRLDERHYHRSRALAVILLMCRKLLMCRIRPDKTVSAMANVLQDCGYLSLDLSDNLRPNVYWIDEQITRRIIDKLGHDREEADKFIIVTRHNNMIQLMERFYCELVTKAPWTGVESETLLGVFTNRCGAVGHLKRMRVDIEPVVDTAFIGGDRTCCPCYDCVLESSLLDQFGIPDSVLNIIYDEHIVRTFEDIRTLV